MESYASTIMFLQKLFMYWLWATANAPWHLPRAASALTAILARTKHPIM